MTQKKQTSKKKPILTKVKNTAPIDAVDMCMKEEKELQVAEARISSLTMAEDFRNSVLIVSLLVNLFILTAWVTLQVTTQYDYSVSAFIFGR